MKRSRLNRKTKIGFRERLLRPMTAAQHKAAAAMAGLAASFGAFSVAEAPVVAEVAANPAVESLIVSSGTIMIVSGGIIASAAIGDWLAQRGWHLHKKEKLAGGRYKLHFRKVKK